jgi:hypothetical protein
MIARIGTDPIAKAIREASLIQRTSDFNHYK